MLEGVPCGQPGDAGRESADHRNLLILMGLIACRENRVTVGTVFAMVGMGRNNREVIPAGRDCSSLRCTV